MVLINPGAQTVRVSEGEVATGTRATVVLDDPKEIGEDRKVRVSVVGTAYDGQTGWVMRKYLKPE